MKEASEVTYKGHVLIALAIPERGMYASMLITVESDGVRRASGTLGMFPGAFQAQDFALQHGMAEIDRRPLPLPLPDWTPIDRARPEVSCPATLDE